MVWARGIEVGRLTGGEIDGGGEGTRWWWRLMEAKGLGFERRSVSFKVEGERSEVLAGDVVPAGERRGGRGERGEE